MPSRRVAGRRWLLELFRPDEALARSRGSGGLFGRIPERCGRWPWPRRPTSWRGKGVSRPPGNFFSKQCHVTAESIIGVTARTGRMVSGSKLGRIPCSPAVLSSDMLYICACVSVLACSLVRRRLLAMGTRRWPWKRGRSCGRTAGSSRSRPFRPVSRVERQNWCSNGRVSTPLDSTPRRPEDYTAHERWNSRCRYDTAHMAPRAYVMESPVCTPRVENSRSSRSTTHGRLCSRLTRAMNSISYFLFQAQQDIPRPHFLGRGDVEAACTIFAELLAVCRRCRRPRRRGCSSGG